jgi:hypothetical protein
LHFELGVGSASTILKPSNASESLWLEELTADAEASFGDSHGVFWVGMNYAVPLASSPEREHPEPQTGQFLDPQVRLSFQVGGSLTVSDSGWDAFTAATFVDRGELEKTETMLPILDGGFDQLQFTVGVQHRFGPKPCYRDSGECTDE